LNVNSFRKHGTDVCYVSGPVEPNTQKRKRRHVPWGLRLLIFAFLFVLMFVVLSTGTLMAYAALRAVIPGWHPGLVADLLYRLSFMAAALVGAWICTRWLERLPWRAIGLTLHRGWLRDFLIGSVVGIASLAIATAIATVGGGLSFTTFGPGEFTHVIETLIGSIFVLIIAALAEEAFARGYLLQTMSRAGLPVLGVLVTSFAFAGLHVLNPNFSKGLPFVNLIIAGVWFGVAYLRTRSLWFPLGMHWAWNWALGSFFGLPVSGKTVVEYPLLHGTDLGPAWLTGGGFGIEGGIACTIALIVSTLFVWRTRLLSADEELLALTSERAAEVEVA
jgi:membrane protease YdiL (CAAX protease family)